MNAKARYTVAADALTDWRDTLFNGATPTFYEVGAGVFELVEIGPGRVIVIGGPPGGGKTALVTQWTIDALRAVPTLRAVLCSVEMSVPVLLDRQLARLAGVPLDVIARRKLDASHAERIDRGLATLESVADRLAFVDPPFELGNVADTADEFGGELLTLDYLQRIRPPGEHGDKRGRVDALMGFLRQFAEAGCAVLCVSAVARSKDRRGRSTYDGDALSLASYRESSELEYGADLAYMLVGNPDAPEAMTLRCLKHRHGEPVDISLRFERSIQSFTPTEPATEMPGECGKLAASLRVLWGSTPTADDDASETED